MAQKTNTDEPGKASSRAGSVQASIDGSPLLRKVDLKVYKSYQELSDALAKMFGSFTMGNYGALGMNSSDYVPTYEDKDGDWMLVGDVPWEMFVDSCKRLRIMKGSEAIRLVKVDAGLAGVEKDSKIKSSKRVEGVGKDHLRYSIPPPKRTVRQMMAKHVAISVKPLLDKNVILKLFGNEVLESTSEPGKKEEMRQKVEELKRKAKGLKRRTDFLHLILSYPMKSEADKENQPCLGSKISSINQEISKYEASMLDECNHRCSIESSEDINRKIQELFREIEGNLAEYDFDMAAYLPQDMVENTQDPPEHSASRTEPVELIRPSTSAKSENSKRAKEDGMFFSPPDIFKLAINSAVHQIVEYFEARRFGKIGISGSGWEEVAKALKEKRDIFHVVDSVSQLQHQSIKDLQINILKQQGSRSEISTSASTPPRCLLLVDSIHQQIDPLDEVRVDGIYTVLKTQPHNVNHMLAVDLEIRMEDHLLPWNLFCKNAGRVLDHSSTLQQKAERLVEECHGHLLAIILLARALKDVSDAGVWELALQELMWQPLSQVQGMNVVMINVLRFIWERMSTTTKSYISCLLRNIQKKPLLISHGIAKIEEEEHILEELTTSFLLENVGKGLFRMREETRLVLLNIFITGKDPAYLKQGNLGLPETPKAKEWVAKEIEWMDNKISELPESPNCSFLVKLFLQENYDLMVIPLAFFECMPVLQVLDMSYTSIKSLPKSISKLVALREFFLRGCDLLMELPPEIGALTNLEVFDLHGTEIMYLPEDIREVVNLTSFKVSFSASADFCKEIKGVTTIIPRYALSNLSQLNELSIDVQPDGDWWGAEVKAIINELCSLKNLRILKLYVPIVELLEKLRWDNTFLIYPTLTQFNFIVGCHVQRFMCCPPHEVEEELEKFEKVLKYINGEGIPIEITKILKQADAFSLERHWTVKNLSEFGLKNMDKLKFCLLVACNEFQTIINDNQFYPGDCEEEDDGDESELDSNFDNEIVLGSLQYLSIHYMKNMESIHEGPVRKGFLSGLKSLALHTCPRLTTIFTLDMLGNMTNLKELTVQDCPKISSLVSLEGSSLKSDHFLPSLKKISLLDLSELVSISSGLCIAPKLESMVIIYCPKLKKLSCKEVSSKDLMVIKGQNEWWDALKWYETDVSSDQQDYLARKFIPLRSDGDLIA